MRSSMAHAASLGRAVAASGICVAWPDQTFRFTIAAPGDTLTISASMGHPAHPAGAAAMPTEQAPARTAGASSFGQPSGGAGNALPPGRRAHVPDGTATGGFYQALDELAENLGGLRRLRDCHGADGWPRQGVYFFFEPGEVRADGRDRVVRVGTHALTAASQAILWGRLRQHRGHVGGRHPGGGNHRASVFRRHVGAAIIQRRKLPPGYWIPGSTATDPGQGRRTRRRGSRRPSAATSGRCRFCGLPSSSGTTAAAWSVTASP